MFSFLKRKTANLRAGKPETKPDASSHTAGVKQGNARGNLQKEKGIVSAPAGELAEGAKATARRSTGINPDARDPIDPRMPNLPPP
jgi:hypothetical protein